MFRSFVSISLIANDFCLAIKRNAGHSKWQNIRHIKGAKDAERSAAFTKLSRQMRVAVQEGGTTDISNNLKLEHLVEQAKRLNMPNQTIQNVLKSCTTDKSAAKLSLLEIKGPGSCFVLCEVFTHQPHTVKQNLASILKRHQSKYSDGGGMHMFVEKGIVATDAPTDKSPEVVLEEATDDAIESGAEDVKLFEDNILEFTCGTTNLRSVVAHLKTKYNILNASVELLPQQYQVLAPNDLELYQKLHQKMSELPEVVRIFDNVMPSE